jgi:hypothetical protein
MFTDDNRKHSNAMAGRCSQMIIASTLMRWRVNVHRQVGGSLALWNLVLAVIGQADGGAIPASRVKSSEVKSSQAQSEAMRRGEKIICNRSEEKRGEEIDDHNRIEHNRTYHNR